MPALIQTIIALIVVYILFSIINSILVEALARWIKMRAKFLKNSLFKLLQADSDGKVDSQDLFQYTGHGMHLL